MPFAINYQRNLMPSVNPILQLINSSDDVHVFAWQLQLEILPAVGSVGELLFDATSAPPDSLFGQDPGPISFLEDPGNTVMAFDAESNPE